MHDETQALSDLEPSTPSSFASNHLEMACIVEKEMHIGQT
jgi:hypothetical protein